jgi:hypothetical protein
MKLISEQRRRDYDMAKAYYEGYYPTILAESDLIIICLRYRWHLEANSSIALTIVLSSAALESRISIDKKKISRKIPL